MSDSSITYARVFTDSTGETHFDEVEIVQATDEDVERFAVQVGNDTDPKRKPRYQEMRCVVSPECRLSENSMRILERMFGAVEVGELEH